MKSAEFIFKCMVVGLCLAMLLVFFVSVLAGFAN